MVLGAGEYLAVVLRYGFYKGHQWYYRTPQGNGLLARAAQATLTCPPTQLVVDHHNMLSSIELDRISPMAIAEYSDDTLAGYADEEFAKGGERLADQQRGLVLPLVERAAAELPDGSTWWAWISPQRWRSASTRRPTCSS